MIGFLHVFSSLLVIFCLHTGAAVEGKLSISYSPGPRKRLLELIK